VLVMGSLEQQIIAWIKQDASRMEALQLVSQLPLPDWCLGAGFVRNLVWDRLHQYQENTPLNDIDVVYFDPDNTSPDADIGYEQRLCALSSHPWSVKNQARMHLRHGHAPYSSTAEAISHWVEIETAVGAKLNAAGEIELVAPLGIEALFNFTISHNPRHSQPWILRERAVEKGWLTRWPRLHIAELNSN